MAFSKVSSRLTSRVPRYRTSIEYYSWETSTRLEILVTSASIGLGVRRVLEYSPDPIWTLRRGPRTMFRDFFRVLTMVSLIYHWMLVMLLVQLPYCAIAVPLMT